MSKDYYKILGVTEFDSAENIKSAYRKLARKWHPDIAGNTPDVLNKFKEINEAYDILSNSIKKEEYDRARRFYNYASQNKNQEAKNFENYKKTSSNPNAEKKNFHFNWEEFLGKKYRETTFKKQETKAPKNGSNINTDLEITVFEALCGVTKSINMLQTEVCPKCFGKRFINGTTCPNCKGKGEFTNYKKFTVKIPAEIKDGSKIRLAGEGGKGLNGGYNGDLYITIHVKELNDYKTEGNNILKTIPITHYEAVLGTTLKISTIHGAVQLKISPNTQNGQKIRLAGCGIVQNEKVGDMIVTVEIKIPKNLSQEEIDLYKQLERISNNSIRDCI